MDQDPPSLIAVIHITQGERRSIDGTTLKQLNGHETCINKIKINDCNRGRKSCCLQAFHYLVQTTAGVLISKLNFNFAGDIFSKTNFAAVLQKCMIYDKC